MVASSVPTNHVPPAEGRGLRHVALVVFAGSRTGDTVFEVLKAEFGESLLSAVMVKTGRAFEKAARAAKDAGARVLAVGGGDGTLGKAAELCIELDLALGIIPTGTGNALAHELEIPIDPSKALRLLESAVESRIDVGKAGDTTFVTVATVGISADIAKLLDKSGKSRFGRLAYIPAVIRAVRIAKPVLATIEADGQVLKRRVMQIVVASSRTHGGPFPASQSATNDDGKLSVYAVTTLKKSGLFWYALFLLGGRHEYLPDVWSVESESVTIRLAKPRRFVLDGEPTTRQNIEFRSEHKALRVMVPKKP